MGGAKKMGESALENHRVWFGDKFVFQAKFVTRPIVWKIFMTLFLLGTLGGGYGIILNIIKKF